MAKITVKQLANFAADELESGTDLVLVAQKLAGFLLQDRRSKDASALFRAIDKELASRGNSQVVITSAHQVSGAIKNQLSTVLDVKNPVYVNVIDPSVVGGVKAQSGELEIDLTVRERLNRFNKQVKRSSE